MTSNDYQNQFVPGPPLDSWVSSVQAYQAATGLPQNQVVYSFADQGQQIPIAIILDNNLGVKEETVDMVMDVDNTEINGDHCQWIAGQEECVAHEADVEVNITEAEVHASQEKEYVKIEEEKKKDDDVIKIYKKADGKKCTLRNLKKQRLARSSERGVNNSTHVSRKKKPDLSKLHKPVNRLRRKKNKSDLPYHPPQSVKKSCLPG